MKKSAVIEALRLAGMDDAVKVVESMPTRRRAVKVRTRPVSEKMTPELAHRIQHLLGTTDLATHKIAALVNVNPGRVTEVQQGRWL
jgi:hypothetical protein